MALLQRMVADPKIGLNYDFMGLAEFEFGVTRNARAELATFMLDGKMTARRVAFEGKWGVTKYKFAAVVIGEKDFIDNMKPTLSVTLEKGAMRYENKDVLGWMTVGADYHKLIILRDDADCPANINRLEKFLKPFAEAIAEDRQLAA